MNILYYTPHLCTLYIHIDAVHISLNNLPRNSSIARYAKLLLKGFRITLFESISYLFISILLLVKKEIADLDYFSTITSAVFMRILFFKKQTHGFLGIIFLREKIHGLMIPNTLHDDS